MCLILCTCGTCVAPVLRHGVCRLQVSCVSSAGAVLVFLLILAFCKYKKLF